jgi:hypothetical protein
MAKQTKKGATKKTAAPGKAEIAYRMLTAAKGMTRAAIVEACGGWGIDVKQFCARKNLKLRKDKDGALFATPAV